ncbi:unnamed protein product [Scytosiphon promiscuus]
MDIDTPRLGEGDGDGMGVSASVSFATVSGPKMPSTAEMRRTLFSAVEVLSQHGLKLSTKWATEQLIGLPDETPEEKQHLEQDESDRPHQQHQQHQHQQQEEGDLWLKGRVAFAKSLMDVGEFERASQAFGDKQLAATPEGGGDISSGLPSRARFLRWYSLFLAGERRREEESQLTDALQRRRLVNPHLKALHAELSACDEEGTLDAFGLFIYAAVLKAMREEGRGGERTGPTAGANTSGADVPGGRDGMSGRGGSAGGFATPTARGPSNARNGSFAAPEAAKATTTSTTTTTTTSTTAQEVLARSLRLFPYNWSAWLDLASLCLETDTVPEGLEADPPCTWMYQFFLQHLLVEQHRSKDALHILDNLHPSFPGSSYVLSQTAIAHYHLRNFDQGHADFKELRRRDPLRMEGLDVFSNILYVKECKAELSFLAHATNKSAPLRPETNCIIGNYYSLKGQHEKAVTYFLKALRLDRRCLSAWTLMGHEFVELKNSGAAIESYRQAVDINPKDYRAWYGLGQAYEILQMHLYAIYYYRRATALRPYDARMWIAMGQCLEKLGKRAEAISTYERAMANDDREGIALARLADLYKAAGRKDSAAKCYETMLANRSVDGDSSSAEEGMRFLCHYYKDKGDYARASETANGLLDYTGTSREEALAVLREIRSIMDTRQYQRDASVSVNNNTANNASPDGGPGRPLFTPRVAMGSSRHLGSGAGSRGGNQLFHANNGAGDSAGAAAARGSGGVFPTPTPRRRGRGSGASPSGGGTGAGAATAVGGASGIADYRLMDNSGGAPSFDARSPGNMSVAMSVASDDDILLTSPRRSRSSTTEGRGAAGLDTSSGAGGSAEGGESFSDFLSP